MVDHLRDVPCIAVWSPFNAAWGQHRTMEVGKLTAAYDTTRPINIASGGNFFPIGDIADEHHYPDPGFPLDDKRFDDYIKVVGEFGGHGMPITGFNGTKLTLETPKLHGSFGNCCYAPQTFSATPKQDGQRIQIGRLRIGTPGMPFTFEPTGSSRAARQQS